MRFIACLLALIVAVSSVWAQLSFLTLVAVLGICALPWWWTFLKFRPLIMCRWCDRGRDWDTRHAHFGRRCPGRRVFILPVPRSSCEGVGERLRTEVRILRIFGFMGDVDDPVAKARSARQSTS